MTSEELSDFPRDLFSSIEEHLSWFPVVALLGPRQCGKTTLAKQVAARWTAAQADSAAAARAGQSTGTGAVYLDLESPRDQRKLAEPELFLDNHTGRLVILDEIQRRPELFPVLRSFVDRTQRKSPLLLLGSASGELIRQSSESLAGRIAVLELTPFLQGEVSHLPLTQLWTRGTFPGSLLAPSETLSRSWRRNYLRTLMERDLPQLGLPLPLPQLQRLLQLLAHSHGELLNSHKLGEALGVSHNTFRRHVDFLEQAFLIRTLRPREANLKKRLVKSPKVYFRDSGLLHSLLEIGSFEALMGHPVQGASWEGFAIEQLAGALGPEWSCTFYRTQVGAELDLVLQKGERRVGVELKASVAPIVSRGFWSSLEDLGIEEAWIVCPIDESYPYRNGVQVGGIAQLVAHLRE